MGQVGSVQKDKIKIIFSSDSESHFFDIGLKTTSCQFKDNPFKTQMIKVSVPHEQDKAVFGTQDCLLVVVLGYS